MSKPDNGGPAFPLPEHLSWAPHDSHGMSLRDWFASQCDQPGEAEIITAAGLTARSSSGYFVVFADGYEMTFSEWWRSMTQAERFALYAKVRYAIADAMLAERSK